MAQIASKITPFLWYADKAEEAARFYVSVFPNSSIDSCTAMNAESPSGPPGSVEVVEFTLDGLRFVAMKAGPMDNFNHPISFVVGCKDQAEVDHYWDKLGQGGSYEQCGWLKDKYGLAWQITPTILTEMQKDKDRARAKRVTEAMLKMKKLDIATLKRAYDGN